MTPETPRATQDVIELTETTRAQALADLAKGALDRLSSAAWAARRATELITSVDYDALEQIAEAERHLADARRHAVALRTYREANRD